MLASARRAKIIATLGPACTGSDQEILDLIDAGADVLRVNTSHLSPAQAAELYERLDGLRGQSVREWALLADLQGPKLRLGSACPDVGLAAGDRVTLCETARAGRGEIPVSIDQFASEVSAGTRIVLGDGTPELAVLSVSGHQVECEAVRAGRLRPRMGVSVPGGLAGLPALTEADLEHLAAAVQHADWVALSFVRGSADVRLLRDALRIRRGRARIIAKIERASAVDAIEEILADADAVMVARGDLGVEIGLAQVPFAQEAIIEAACRACKPAVTATQVLESVVHADAPTRAEVADIAQALVEGTSALMLSAETATGDHPVLAVQIMAEVIQAAERHLTWEARDASHADSRRASLVRAADQLASDQDARVLLVPTETGETARLAAALARQRIVALCPDPAVRRQLALERGVTPLDWDGRHGAYLPATLVQKVTGAGLIRPGRRVVVSWSHVLDDPADPVQLVAALSLPASDA